LRLMRGRYLSFLSIIYSRKGFWRKIQLGFSVSLIYVMIRMFPVWQYLFLLNLNDELIYY
jgi:hypothetical protein